MVVFSYLCLIFRDFPLTCVSERLNRYLPSLFMIRMKTRSSRIVKVTDNIRRGGIAIENEPSSHYGSLARETLTLATVSICCIC